jgi:periplasmic protein TonB
VTTTPITLWNPLIRLYHWSLAVIFSAHVSFALVVLVHLAILVAILNSTEDTRPIAIIPPSIQGMIISAPPEEAAPQPLFLPPQTELPKPASAKVPLPKAAPSERAIQHEAKPEPIIANEQKPLTQSPQTQVAAEQLIMPHTDAAHINNPAPVYPVLSRRAREQGIVILEILVLANGGVEEVRLTTSSGHTKLDQAAMAAVKQWRFVAAKRGGQAIDFWYELPIEFSLKK